MCYSRTVNNAANRIQEKACRDICTNESNLSFDELLNEDRMVSTHMKNRLLLPTDIFSAKNKLSPQIISEIFSFIENPTKNLSQL